MELTVLVLPSQTTKENKVLRLLLNQALQDIPHRMVSELAQVHLPAKLLIAFALGTDGINVSYLKLLAQLRNRSQMMDSSLAGIVVQSDSLHYGKGCATQFALALNQGGCALVPRPLVEISHQNLPFPDPFLPQDDPRLDWVPQIHQLAERIMGVGFRGNVPLSDKPMLPRVTVVFPVGEEYAALPEVAQSYDLWEELRHRLAPFIHCTELCLQTDTIHQCNQCINRNCRRFLPDGTCFYGAALGREGILALSQTDALLLVCPSFHNNLHGYMLSFSQQLSSLFAPEQMADKALFALILSPYSGGEMVAEQLINSFIFQQGCYLPSHFALIECASPNDNLLNSEDLTPCLDQFAHGLLELLSLGKLN